jgi:hypothetical protein
MGPPPSCCLHASIPAGAVSQLRRHQIPPRSRSTARSLPASPDTLHNSPSPSPQVPANPRIPAQLPAGGFFVVTYKFIAPNSSTGLCARVHARARKGLSIRDPSDLLARQAMRDAKWISMRCRAGRGRARLFFTLGAVRSGKRDTLLHAAPTRSTELTSRGVRKSQVLLYRHCLSRKLTRPRTRPRASARAIIEEFRPVQNPETIFFISKFQARQPGNIADTDRQLLHLRRSCFSWTLAALGLLFSRNKELKADAYQVA